jgi:hypothetical protein
MMGCADIRTACQSWRGIYMKRFNASRSVRSADALRSERTALLTGAAG